MLIKKPQDIKPSEITDRSLYLERRKFIGGAGLSVGAAALGLWGLSVCGGCQAKEREAAGGNRHGKAFPSLARGPFGTDEPQTAFKDATSYCNFYEFGSSKQDPVNKSGEFKPHPWSVTIDGECDRPGTYDLEYLMRPQTLCCGVFNPTRAQNTSLSPLSTIQTECRGSDARASTGPTGKVCASTKRCTR